MKTPMNRESLRLQRVLQVVADTTPKPLAELRILDLACYHGDFGLEFARRGATVIATEGRVANLEKAEAAKQALNLTNIQFFQDDIRYLSKEKYGTFDVVLCLGILYHLDTPEVFHFLEQIYEVCDGFVVIDTHVSPFPIVARAYKGKTYWGRVFLEHVPESSPDEKMQKVYQSLDNLQSFWLTRASLYNALAEVGFTSAYECGFPTSDDGLTNRAVVVAFKGQRQQLLSYESPAATPVREVDGLPLLLYRLYRRTLRPLRAFFLRTVLRRQTADDEFGFWGRFP